MLDVGEHRVHGVIREPQRVRPRLSRAPGSQRDVQDQVPAVREREQPDPLGQILRLPVHAPGPGQRRQALGGVPTGNELAGRHPDQDSVDADGEVTRAVHAGLVQRFGLVRAGQAARDDGQTLARHRGRVPVHLGHQLALLPVALSRPDHARVLQPWGLPSPGHPGQRGRGSARDGASLVSRHPAPPALLHLLDLLHRLRAALNCRCGAL